MASRGWISRLTPGALAAVAILGGALGCDNKGGGIPTAPPLAASEPTQILQHLRYVAVRKDYRHIILIAPISPDVVYPSASWFHKHSTDLKIELAPEEMTALNVGALKDRLPNLPKYEEKGYGIEEARLAFNAGLYRVLKGVPAEAWGDVNISEVKSNASNTRVTDLYLGYKGKQIMQVSCLKKPDGNYGVSFIRYLAMPGGIFKDAGKK